MRIIPIILFLLITLVGYSQVEYQPEEMFVQNRFGIPYRDTTGNGKLGEVRCRPQDNKYYGWAGDVLRWQQLGSGTSGTASFTATPPLLYSSNVLSMPRASATDSGYISTGTQSIAGLKTFVSAGLNVQPTSTNTTGYYQINNNAGNFQLALTQASGYPTYGIFQGSTGGFYTSASNGMAFLLDGGGSFKVGFGSNGTPVFEVGSSQANTRVASSLLQQTASTLSFTGAGSHTILTSISPSGFAAIVRALSDAGIDCRMQATTTGAFIGTTSNHDLDIVSNNSIRISLPAAGGIGFTLGSDATGDLYARGAGGTLQRIAAGTSGYVLTSGGAGTVPSWQAGSSGYTFTNGLTNSSGTVSWGGTLTGPTDISGGTSLTFGVSGTPLASFHVNVSGAVNLQGGLITKRLNAVNNNYSVASTDQTVPLDEITGNKTLTLPTATNGRWLVIQNMNSNADADVWSFSPAVVLKDGTTLTTLANQSVYWLQGDGTNWRVMMLY